MSYLSAPHLSLSLDLLLLSEWSLSKRWVKWIPSPEGETEEVRSHIFYFRVPKEVEVWDQKTWRNTDPDGISYFYLLEFGSIWQVWRSEEEVRWGDNYEEVKPRAHGTGLERSGATSRDISVSPWVSNREPHRNQVRLPGQCTFILLDIIGCQPWR